MWLVPAWFPLWVAGEALWGLCPLCLEVTLVPGSGAEQGHSWAWKPWVPHRISNVWISIFIQYIVPWHKGGCCLSGLPFCPAARVRPPLVRHVSGWGLQTLLGGTCRSPVWSLRDLSGHQVGPVLEPDIKLCHCMLNCAYKAGKRRRDKKFQVTTVTCFKYWLVFGQKGGQVPVRSRRMHRYVWCA